MRLPGNALAVIAVLFAGSALAQSPMPLPPDPSGATTFVMPSGNIACIYTPAGGSSVYVPVDGGPELACDIAEPNYLRLVLADNGPAQLLNGVSDPSCCGGTTTLPYGQWAFLPPFVCRSGQSGLTCQHNTTGHGFFMSKAQIQAY